MKRDIVNRLHIRLRKIRQYLQGYLKTRDLNKIIAKHKLGYLRFGMSPVQIKDLLGNQLVWENWMGGNLNNALCYHGLVLVFDLCNGAGPKTTPD
jgi:hypothetical protein